MPEPPPRAPHLFMIDVAARAGRKADAVAFAGDAARAPGPLDHAQRKHITAAFSARLEELRDLWRTVDDWLAAEGGGDEDEEEDDARRRARRRTLAALRMRCSLDIHDLCKAFAALVDEVLALEPPQPRPVAAALLASRADFLRYGAEPLVGDARAEAADEALDAYQAAEAAAAELFRPCDKQYVAVVVNVCVLHEELKGNPRVAHSVARAALLAARSALDAMPHARALRASKFVDVLEGRVETWAQLAGIDGLMEADEEEEPEEEPELTLEDIIRQFST